MLTLGPLERFITVRGYRTLIVKVSPAERDVTRIFERAALQTSERVVDGNAMSTLGSRRVDKVRAGVRQKRKALLYVSGIVVFASAVITVAVEVNTSLAVMTGLLMVAVVGMAVGLWGAAMAVRETDELGWPRVDELSRTVAIGNAPSPR